MTINAISKIIDALVNRGITAMHSSKLIRRNQNVAERFIVANVYHRKKYQFCIGLPNKILNYD